MNDFIITSKLKDYVYSRLEHSTIPVERIITPNVFFARKVTEIGTYLYYHKKKYYIRIVTMHKSEEELYAFQNEDELTFSFIALQIVNLARREYGHNYKKEMLALFRSIDEEYYIRAKERFGDNRY